MTNVLAILALLAPAPASVGDGDRRILDIQECFVGDGTQFVGSFGYLPAAKGYFEFGYTQDRTSTLAMSGLLEGNRIQFQPSWSGSKEPYRADMILDFPEGRFSFIGYTSGQGGWQKQYTANFRKATAADQERCTLPTRG